jgi:succinate dehydrogenase/fumarate reductase flavoprotein subunit
MDEFYGRAMPAAPARVAEQDFVPLAQLYGRFALAVDDRGDPFAPDEVSWSETELVQALARRPAARAWYLVDGRVLREEVRGTTVAEMIGRGERAGGTVYRAGGVGALADTLGFELPDSPRLREAPFTAVHVVAGITHTIGGIATDAAARVLGLDGAPIEGLYAAGADAGGVSTGGYASGLATALVFGRIAAETAARA